MQYWNWKHVEDFMNPSSVVSWEPDYSKWRDHRLQSCKSYSKFKRTKCNGWFMITRFDSNGTYSLCHLIAEIHQLTGLVWSLWKCKKCIRDRSFIDDCLTNRFQVSSILIFFVETLFQLDHSMCTHVTVCFPIPPRWMSSVNNEASIEILRGKVWKILESYKVSFVAKLYIKRLFQSH